MSDEALRARRRHEWRQLARPALQLQTIVDLAVLVAHAQANIGLAEVLHDVGREDVPRFVDVAKSRCDFTGRIYRHKRERGVAPDGRVLLAVAKQMRVSHRDRRQLRHPQAQLDPRFPTIECHLRMKRLEPGVADWIKTAVAVVPAPEFRVTGPDVTD